MKIYTTLAALQLGLALAASVSAQDAPVEVTVLATMDPWKAGGYDDGSDGLTPAAFTFAAGPKQFITFPRITGIWSCGTGTPAYGPDGTDMTQVCNGPRYINGPIGTFAGYATTDFQGALVGIILTDDLPVSAPPLLRFYISDNSQGGIPTSFKALNPRIGEIFFIGDGLTGTGTGAIQAFLVPSTATHLYLGYVDGIDGIPEGYTGNFGGLKVIVQLHQGR